ncbi:Carboxylic ester hydrolase [Mycena indigotica]|uniref:Carboxylic ester hydrolase n=1 Tax=Mycena indigotica TaxID=2126181 RepID=A0A8H6VVA3_9AGAR|nr:Carboxylic ester hydrolase [Mycena indigotica]KAF7291408.1 Carboxylic ester hydrolase [Mycena indigotica]
MVSFHHPALPLAALAVLVAVAHGATLQLGRTTLTGLDIPTFGQELFGGIPFAEPPLAEKRFLPPILKTTLSEKTFDASKFGPACLQAGTAQGAMSEDCLTINVLRPAGTPSHARLPVMFWTYGGGFQEGQSSIYNGSAIVAQSVLRGTPVIYVNFNYRLGPLGFPQGHEADTRGALNLGMKDQLAALEWVQANIGTFGGDKSKVMVFGESAGAIMTALLFLNSPITRLARAAIFESGSPSTSALFTPERREISWQNFVGGVPSCAALTKSRSTFSCLRKASSNEILAGFNASIALADEEFPWDPVLDGPTGLIPDLPSVLFKRGHFAKLPFMAGTNLDEGTIFTPTNLLSPEELQAEISSLFTPSAAPAVLNSSIAKVLELYPDNPSLGSPFGTGNQTFGLSPQFKRAAAIIGDVDFLAPRRQWVAAAASHEVPTFVYHFTEPQPEDPPSFGVPHGSEILWVYGAPADPAPTAVALSRIMTDYWISFATSLTPNDGLGVPKPAWTQWTPKNKAAIQLDGANLTMVPDNFRGAQTDFFNSDPTIWRH